MSTLRSFSNPYRLAKRFLQRGVRGWADEDVWNLDTYLAGVLAGSLRYLADTKQSYPGDCCPARNPVTGACEETGRTSCCGSSIWDGELQNAAELFSRLHRDAFFGSRWYEDEEVVEQAALAWLSRRWGSLWD